MFDGIDHLCMDVSDLAKAKGFYVGLLGFRQRGDELLRGNGMRTIFLERDGVMLELKCPSTGPIEPRSQPNGFCPQLNHVALRTPDIQEAYRELCKKNVPFSKPPTFVKDVGRWIAVFHDPDGNCFHLTS